jgi:ribosomal protein S27AE
MIARLLCVARGHVDRTSVTITGADAFRSVSCARCGRVRESVELAGAEVCAILGHDMCSESDRIVEVRRDGRTGELTFAAIRRRFACSRCGLESFGATPPELIPPDLFDRIEDAIESQKLAATLDGIELDLASLPKN